jgi:hypothetical protein
MAALHHTVLEELLDERVVACRGRVVPRGLKRKMSNYPLRPRGPQRLQRRDIRVLICGPISPLK